MLAIIGLCIILTIVILLLTEKMSPFIAMVLVPLIGALVAGFDVAQLKTFYLDGTKSVTQIVIMFIFAIIFFGIMSDVGLFKPLIDRLIKLTGGNVVAVCLGTVLISVVAHLDGTGATTFLLVVPALLPLYKRLNMNPYLLFLLLAASAGLVNMLPWGGPTGRVATVLNMNVEELYRPLFLVQVIGLVYIIALAIFLGFREQKRLVQLAPNNATTSEDPITSSQSPEPNKYFWFNVALFFATMATLFSGILSPGYVFMIATAILLLVNYRNPAEQLERIQAHSSGAIMMASIILAAGTFLGILKGSGMLNAIATNLVNLLPNALIPYLHIIIGIFGIPLELVLNTDSYYFGLFPVVQEITSQVGVEPRVAGYAMLIGSIVGTFVTPLSPALWMGLGLANLSMGKHIRYSFLWIWALSLAVLFSAILIGVVPLP